MAQIFGPLIAFGLIGYGIYHYLSENPEVLGYIIWSVLGIIALVSFVLIGIPKIQQARIYKASRTTGPMKVQVSIQKYGKGYRLYIDAQMSQKDQDAMERAGIEGYELFDFPHPKFPEARISYCNATLLHVKHVDFPNLVEAEEAKRLLLSGLHDFRSRLEQSKEQKIYEERGSKPEAYEI